MWLPGAVEAAVLKLDLLTTLALAGLSLAVGAGVRRLVAPLERFSIPAPAIGGLLFALGVLLLRSVAGLQVSIDSTLRSPLQIAFFTTIGLGATTTLLRSGGRRLVHFWILATVTAVVQNVVGLALARLLGAPLALGLVCGALTLTGGPSTGLAWEKEFEALGLEGAGALIIAAALFGIFTACLVGNPVATALIRRHGLAPAARAAEAPAESKPHHVTEVTATAGSLAHALLILLVLMGAGSLLGIGLERMGVTMPAYIGAMVLAALLRCLDDRTGWPGLDPRALEILGNLALAYFLVLALMGLELWKIAALALPMILILLVQVVIMITYAVLVTFVLMGRDYEAAVTAAGHIGFGLGTTPNAVANMEALVARHGPAPGSFLVVPIVGAFFIDFSNALVIAGFVSWLR